ncbi:response regulator transcription factor [Erythrobacter sp. SD-21]|uniref:response regulator transcription factor n=1 Tax=Erythrobacter sp. SD-21 TaxID=161528 RepID=UPI000153F653|nr:LuxR C-terminal-related transcriptional regulator [Erythrobacter sp. SD-21]EDL50223.1 transcriptional regulator, LuxR family protein [Erythrobacter sp. SD-21]
MEEDVKAHLDKLRALGVRNWVGFALYGPRNRDAFGSAGFSSEPSELAEGVLTATHSILSSAHLQICRIMDRANPEISLSQRERQVLELMGSGKTSVEIGTILAISPETVKTYTKRLYEKLEANDRVTATVRALKLGLVEL